MKLNSELMEFARSVRSIILASYIERPKTNFISIKSSSLAYEVILHADLMEIEMRWNYTRKIYGDRSVIEYRSSGHYRLLGVETATSTIWRAAKNIRSKATQADDVRVTIGYASSTENP